MNIRAARRAVRWDVVEYARVRAVLPNQQQQTVDAWTWLAEFLTPSHRDPADPPEPPTLCRPDGSPLEEIEAMQAKPESTRSAYLPEGSLAELRAFVESCADFPGERTKIRIIPRMGKGTRNGSQPRDITAEMYPEPVQPPDGEQA